MGAVSVIAVVRKLVDISPLSEADRQGLHDALDAEEQPAQSAADAAPAEQPTPEAEPVNPSPAPDAAQPEAQGQAWDTTSVSTPPPFDSNAPT